MIMMCQCRFIHSNKGTALVWNIDSEVIRVGTGGIGDSVLSSHFCCEPKTALKYKGYYFCEWIWGPCSHLTETNVINNLVKKNFLVLEIWNVSTEHAGISPLYTFTNVALSSYLLRVLPFRHIHSCHCLPRVACAGLSFLYDFQGSL